MIECFQIYLPIDCNFSPPPSLLSGQILKLYFKNYFAQRAFHSQGVWRSNFFSTELHHSKSRAGNILTMEIYSWLNGFRLIPRWTIHTLLYSCTRTQFCFYKITCITVQAMVCIHLILCNTGKEIPKCFEQSVQLCCLWRLFLCLHNCNSATVTNI